MRLKPLAVIASSAAVLFSLSACGPPKDGGTYESLAELHSTYTQAGLECPDWAVDKTPTRFASDSGACSNGVSLAIYPDEDKALLASVLSDKASNPGTRSERPFSVSGENWVVKGGDIEKLTETTGGKVSQLSIGLKVPVAP